ncbi:MAG: hypothetical protein GF393_02770 [Armatimonadia bacterium]|nr:hypothetical protein [Armatimonadia bacterium]
MGTKMKTVLIVVALLVGIAGFNWFIQMDPTQLAARGVGKDPHSHDHDDGHDHDGEDGEAPKTLQDLMKPMGPSDAEVKIEVLWRDRQDLEAALRPMMTEVVKTYKGHVRVEFIDRKSDEFKRIVEEVTEGIGSGLLINGEMIKEVPEAPLGMLAFSGSPSFEEWTLEDLLLAIEHELEAAGVEFEPQVEHDHSHAAPPGIPGGPHAGHGHEGHGH